MDFHRDFADLCSLLNANGVDFLIVGGYAVAFHGAPRFTGDLDIPIHPTLEQATANFGSAQGIWLSGGTDRRPGCAPAA